MFFNPDDIRYFKPVELWTKHGLRGHIREPRGTSLSHVALFVSVCVRVCVCGCMCVRSFIVVRRILFACFCEFSFFVLL